MYFFLIVGVFLDLESNIEGFGQNDVIFEFLRKNDAESSINFVKIPFLDPKRAKLDQQSEIGHVRTCQDLSRRTHKGPYGPQPGPGPNSHQSMRASDQT